MQSDAQPSLPCAEQVELLGSRNRRVRRDAYAALEQAGETALDAVIAGLSHPDTLVRRHCAEFMDHHADQRCIPALHEAVADPSPRVRREALHALGCQRCKPAPLPIDAVPVFVRALVDVNARVRLSAVAGLLIHARDQQVRDPRALGPLRTMLEREPNRLVRKHANRALRLHDPGYRAETDAAARVYQESRGPRRAS